MLIAESIRLAIQELNPQISSGPLPMTASIGVATSADQAMTIEQIQRKADQAMYKAKALGRNRVSSFTQEIIST